MITPRPSLRDCINNPHIRRAIRREFWFRCGHGLVSIAAILLCFGVLMLVLASKAKAVEVPAWVLRGIAQVETGTDWRDIGDVRGTWARGAVGEVGPWQLSPAVLRDLKAYDRRFRIHADPVLAESLTRAWLLRLYGVTGCWHQTCAAFHAGLGKRFAGFATDYAERVRAVGTTTN